MARSFALLLLSSVTAWALGLGCRTDTHGLEPFGNSGTSAFGGEA